MAKKLLSLLLALTMLFGTLTVFTGCGAKDTPAQPAAETAEAPDDSVIPEETVTLNVYSQLANYSGLQAGWISAVLLDKFNVQLNIIPNREGTYETAVESGNLGDLVVWGQDGKQYHDAANLGLLYDWEEDDLVKEYGPYIYEHMQDALENNRSINDDNKIYGFGHGVAADMSDHQAFFYTWDMRWDLYDQLGCPEVADMDGLIDLFLKMKELQPVDENGNESYAMSLWPDWDGDMVMYVKAFATAYWGYDELAGGLFDSDTGEFHPALEKDGPYLTCLKWFNKLYRAGLLDPDSMTATYDTATEKVRNGGVFFQIFDYAGSNVFNTPEHTGKNQMMLPVVPTGATPPAYGMSIYGGNRIWCIGANTAYPELCMQIINWLCTPEGTMALWYGIRDLMWYIDDDGGICLTELGQACADNSKYELDGVVWTSSETGKSYTLGGNFNDGTLQINNITWSMDATNPESKKGETYNKQFWVSQIGDPKCDVEAHWRDFNGGVVGPQYYLENTNYRIIKAYSGWSESDKSEALETNYNMIQDCIVNNSWKAIYATNDGQFNFIVNGMIDQANKYGYEEYAEWGRQQAADKFAAQVN